MKDINLKELEKRAWKETFGDGLWDILLGVIFFVPAVNGMFIDSDYMMLPIYFAAILLFVAGKKYVTIPRIGLVRFGEERKNKRIKVVIALSVSVIVLLLLVTMKKGEVLFQADGFPFGSLIVGLNIFIVAGVMAYFMNFPRLYLYAVLLGAFEPLTALMERAGMMSSPYPVLFVISGGMILYGVYLLVRFIRTYPLQAEER
jgi:hypothetical protein